MVYEMIDTKKQFQDADMQKVDDPMFEDIGMDPAQAGDTGDSEQMPAIDGEDSMSTDEAPTTAEDDAYQKALDDAAAQDDSTVPGEDPTAPDAEGATDSTDDLDAFLAELEQATATHDEAQAALSDVIDASGDKELQDAFDAEKAASAEKDRTIELLKKQLEREKGNSDKILEDKFMLEAENREKSKVADIVMSDDMLKALVVYKNKSATDDSAKQKYVETVKSMFEDATGISVDDLMTQARRGEKSALGGGSYESLANPQDTASMGGMLEQI